MKPLPKQHHPVHSLLSTFKLDAEVIKQREVGERRQGIGREKGGIMANCGKDKKNRQKRRFIYQDRTENHYSCEVFLST
ncbi:hypothetical protein [Microbulbifer sp. THAF38]|uniref:hypothetical protein n=1 Tax=Microbulbifer sp. THAF38 TaxID=2587856 RepID=UPI001561DF86|nr:hypothetical protein [Microbulbifer sp. THAF38]